MTQPSDALARLEATGNAVERNALALHLADERSPGLAQILVRLIQKTDLRDERGTLVYCLCQIGAREHAGLLCDLVIDGNFEVAHTALIGLSDVDFAEGEQITAAAARVRATIRSVGLEEWRRDLLLNLERAFE